MEAEDSGGTRSGGVCPVALWPQNASRPVAWEHCWVPLPGAHCLWRAPLFRGRAHSADAPHRRVQVDHQLGRPSFSPGASRGCGRSRWPWGACAPRVERGTS